MTKPTSRQMYAQQMFNQPALPSQLPHPPPHMVLSSLLVMCLICPSYVSDQISWICRLICALTIGFLRC